MSSRDVDGWRGVGGPGEITRGSERTSGVTEVVIILIVNGVIMLYISEIIKLHTEKYSLKMNNNSLIKTGWRYEKRQHACMLTGKIQ